MKTLSAFTCLITLSVFMSSCGGSSSNGEADLELNNAFCDHPYFQTIIGDYSGRAFFTIPTDTDARAVSCTWDIELSIRHRENPVVCNLLVDINAMVTQSIVLTGDDPLAHQCFDEDSVRNIRDPNYLYAPDELSSVPYPVSLGFSEDFTVTTTGPYFGDESYSVRHERLFDRGRVSRISVDGEGGIEFTTSNGSSIPFNGRVQKIEVSP